MSTIIEKKMYLFPSIGKKIIVNVKKKYSTGRRNKIRIIDRLVPFIYTKNNYLQKDT